MRILYHDVAIGLVALSLAGWTQPTPPVEIVLHGFTGGTDGAQPRSGDLIADKQGALYGTTSSGGTCPSSNSGCGTVFMLTPPAKGQTAWTETVLYSFKGGSDGISPFARLVADERGALYGTTINGGACASSDSGCGTVFKLTPPAKGQTAWTETVLYKFAGSPDGAFPFAGLIVDEQGAFYGTTNSGGTCPSSNFGCGTVFMLTPPAKGQTTWTETVLYSFKGGSDGGVPGAVLIADEQGALYSTTDFGGSGTCDTSTGCGTVFKLTPPAKNQTAWTETVLYNFCSLPNCADGFSSQAGLIADKQGALYGTTILGGNGTCITHSIPGCGTVFKLTRPARSQAAWTEAVLYNFAGSPDGANPEAGLIADKKGLLYGTTALGGSCATSGGGCGTVFKLTPPAKGQTAWIETVLYKFINGSDGAGPEAGLIADKQGALYGTTIGGGTAGLGTVFKLTLCPDNNGDHDGCPVFLSQE
jgi:uncharacterized repeat protein (TIGR03803 family)